MVKNSSEIGHSEDHGTEVPARGRICILFFLLMVTSASEIVLLNTFYKERRKKLSSDGD